MPRFGSTRTFPEEIYLDSSVVIDVFYANRLSDKKKPQEFILRLNETDDFISRLARDGSRLYISLLTIEESLHGTRVIARDSWLRDNLAKLPPKLKLQVEEDIKKQRERLSVSDDALRKHKWIWDRVVRHSRAHVHFILKAVTGSSIALLSPDENETTAIVDHATKLHDTYDLHMADCFHIATGEALGVLQFATNDKWWKQLDGVDGITVYSAY